MICTRGNFKQELTGFIPSGLFNMDAVQRLNVVDIQQQFKWWYEAMFLSDPTTDQEWELQSATGSTVSEFLMDTSLKSNTWSCGLFISRDSSVFNQRLQSMLEYTVNVSLAVTQLATTIGEAVVREEERDMSPLHRLICTIFRGGMIAFNLIFSFDSQLIHLFYIKAHGLSATDIENTHWNATSDFTGLSTVFVVKWTSTDSTPSQCAR